MNTYFYIIMIFSVTVMFWIGGFTSPILGNPTSTYSELNPASLWDSIISWVFSWNGALTVGISVATAAVVGGLNLLVIVPFALLMVLVNLIAFPTQYFASSGLPVEISVPMTLFFNLATFLVAVNFVRSGN